MKKFDTYTLEIEELAENYAKVFSDGCAQSFKDGAYWGLVEAGTLLGSLGKEHVKDLNSRAKEREKILDDLDEEKVIKSWTTKDGPDGTQIHEFTINVKTKPSLEEEIKSAKGLSLAEKQYKRGFSDAQAGHQPSLLEGPYSEGYVAGKSEPKE